jgi:Na+-driven multidrug efflux pump
MATASQHFLTFELGRGNFERLRRVFSLSLVIYALIALAVLLMAETIGLWFVNRCQQVKARASHKKRGAVT